jgi:sarcosine oxidase
MATANTTPQEGTMIERREVVVVGAGLLGLAAARALAARGREVTVLDQAGRIGHDGAGSKGSCRIFRLGYTDARYVAHAQRARELWSELEDISAEKLLHPVPQLSFGPDVPEVLNALHQAGASGELLSDGEAARRFPGIAAYDPVLLEPASSVIAADRALAALASAVPEIRTGAGVTALADDGHQVRVSTSTGAIDARRVIVCAGPWTSGLLATAGITIPAAATQEQVAYLAPAGAGSGGEQAQPARAGAGTGVDAGASAGNGPGSALPIFVHYGEGQAYGLPVPGSALYKMGIHHDGTPADPGHQDQAADEALSHRIGQAARRFLPGCDPDPVRVERCVYDNSPDTDFIVDRVGNIVIGSGTSGHGFKFGPLFGTWLAALAADQAGPAGRISRSGIELPPPDFAVSRL